VISIGKFLSSEEDDWIRVALRESMAVRRDILILDLSLFGSLAMMTLVDCIWRV
jgi:hypothetical protein